MENIRKAHRRLVMQYHPDRNPGNEEAAGKLQEVNRAYAELTGRATEPDNEETAALEYVLTALLKVMNFLSEKGTSPGRVDVLGMMAQWLKDQQQEVENCKTANQVMIRNLRESRSRFRGKAREALRNMVDWQIGNCNYQSRQYSQTSYRFDRALELLKDTTFEFMSRRAATVLNI
jgi:hypothetical protein